MDAIPTLAPQLSQHVMQSLALDGSSRLSLSLGASDRPGYV
jgi:hypothetical protein